MSRSQAASAGKNVTVMGGAGTGQAYIKAGLEVAESIQTPSATHLRFRIVR